MFDYILLLMFFPGVLYTIVMAFYVLRHKIANSFKRAYAVLISKKAITIYAGLGISIMANNINFILTWDTVNLLKYWYAILFGIMLLLISVIIPEDENTK